MSTVPHHSATPAPYHTKAAAAVELPKFDKKLSNFLELRLGRLTNCTKNPFAAAKNFYILPIVKTLDKIQNL